MGFLDNVPGFEDPPRGAEGADLLDRVERYLGRFVAYPSEAARVAAVLWAAHAHLIESFESTPRLLHASPEPGSGKTRGLEALGELVPRPMHAVNATPAALFRAITNDEGRPTILFDEIDTVFGPKAKENEEVRGLLNAGHRRSGVAYRCVGLGTNQQVVAFPAFCAVALAGLGDLPDTIMSRAVIIRMRRRAPHERVDAFRQRIHGPEGNLIRDDLATWAKTVGDDVAAAWPDMPDGVEDRAADVWEPLLAVADAAGGDWPGRARVAAVTLVTQASERTPTLGIRLLEDIRTVFTDANREHLFTEDLINRLIDIDESPWGDLRGKALDARGLARRLKPYEVTPKPLRIGEQVARGYSITDLSDAWSRYLPPPSDNSVTSVTSVTACRVCQEPLDPQLAECGDVTHPACTA